MNAATRKKVVLDLLKGKASAGELAARHGVSMEEIEGWKQLFLDGLASDTSRHRRPSSRAVGRSVLALACCGALALIRQANAAPTPCTPPGFPADLKAFCPDTPAIASDVNGNFQKVVTYLEQKTGAYDSPDVTVNGNVSVTGVENNGLDSALAVRSGNDTMRVDGNEIDSNSALGLELQKNNPTLPVTVYSPVNMTGNLVVTGANGLRLPPVSSLPVCNVDNRGAIVVQSTATDDRICVCSKTTSSFTFRCLLERISLGSGKRLTPQPPLRLRGRGGASRRNRRKFPLSSPPPRPRRRRGGWGVRRSHLFEIRSSRGSP